MPKLYSLQPLRAIAFFAIFLWHCGVNLGNIGALGVSIFFILSGFLMVYNYLPKSECEIVNHISVLYNLRFSIKRILKLYPIHIFMLMISAIISVHGLLKTYTDLTIWAKWFISLIVDIFLLQSWVPLQSVYYSFNGVAWFLSVCVFLYFIFPFVLRSIHTYKTIYSAVWSIILVISMQFAIGMISSIYFSSDFCYYITYICPIYRAGDFIIGCNLGYIFLVCSNFQMRSISWTFYEILILLLVTIGLFLSIQLSDFYLSAIILTFGSSGLVYCFAANQGYLSNLFQNKFLTFIGDISGEGFLVHQILIVIINQFFIKFIVMLLGQGYFLMVYASALSFILTLFVAYFSQKCRIKWFSH